MNITLRDPALPIIRTARLTLREIQVSDISQAYVDWLNDPVATQFLEIRFHPQPREEVERYIREKLANTKSFKHFGVYDQDGSRLVGTVTSPHIDWNHLFCEVSFFIGHPDAGGKGYATEAVHGLVYYLFNICGMEKIVAGYYEHNVGSRKVLAKNGFNVEGCSPKKRKGVDGLRTDEIHVGISREQFQADERWLGSLPPEMITLTK